MQRLPDVVTTHGTVALPLCGGTAWRLAAALAGSDGSRPDRSLLADALARDPALALWTILKSHGAKPAPPSTVDALADWLSVEAVDQWHGPPALVPWEVPGGEDVEPWATLAVRSIAIAGQSAETARSARIDERPAFLLGLVHLAHKWLVAAGVPAEAHSEVIPHWLGGELEHIDDGPPGEILAAADCVAAAIASDLPPNRKAHGAAIAAAREDWRRDFPPGLLPRLAAKLRRLCDLEENFQQTLETEKLDSLKELAYGAGHEINNPLANISARAQTLLQDERDPERRRMLASINAQAFRAHEMIADMMLFARPPRPKAEPFDIARLIAGLYEELAAQAAEQQTRFVLHAPRVPLLVTADKTQIAVALRSLCSNALEALVSGGRVEIALAQPQPGDETVRITVSDNGPGIPPESRRHLFDPFYSGREAGRGLGLGLSKCWRIVAMHRGRVEVESSAGQGAVFTVTLPAGNGR